MQHLNVLIFLVLSCCGGTAFGQGLEFSLVYQEATTDWIVYLRAADYQPSGVTYASSGQITLKVDTSTTLIDFQSMGGAWETNMPDVVKSPAEAPGHVFYSLGLNSGSSLVIPTEIGATVPLLRFRSFEGCPISLSLLDNHTDPFAQIPNSVNSNPGNNLTLVDANYNGTGQIFQLDWVGNYDLDAWRCRPVVVEELLKAHDAPAAPDAAGGEEGGLVNESPIPLSPAALEISPNPFETTLTVRVADITAQTTVRAQLFDATGQLVRLQEWRGDRPQALSTDALTPGSYFLVVRAGRYYSSRAVLKQ